MEKKGLTKVLIALGFLISLYLTIARYNSAVLACPSAGVINCESVITGPYSQILGLPTSVLGMILFALGWIMLFKNGDNKFFWSIAGAGAVVYSLSAQAFEGQICIWCLALDLIIILLVYLSCRK